MGNAQAKRPIHLHYLGTSYDVKIYPGTPLTELETSLKRLMSIPPSAQISFLDENGVPVIFSSTIPDDTHLFVDCSICEEKLRRMKLKWSRTDGVKSSDNLSVTGDSTQTFGAVTSPIPIAGRHYIAVRLSDIVCCVKIGVVDSTITSLTQQNNGDQKHLIYVQHIDSEEYHSYPSTMSEKGYPLTIGLLVDMDTKEMYVLRYKDEASDPHIVFRFKNIPDSVRVGYFHLKHGITATILPHLSKNIPNLNYNGFAETKKRTTLCEESDSENEDEEGDGQLKKCESDEVPFI